MASAGDSLPTQPIEKAIEDELACLKDRPLTEQVAGLNRLIAARGLSGPGWQVWQIAREGATTTIRFGEGRFLQLTQRSEGDCLRMSVHKVTGVPYTEVPHQPEFPHPDWVCWAAERGWRWWVSDEFAPVFLPTWIAGVHGPSGRAWHAVPVAGHGRVIADGVYKHTLCPSEIRTAYALIPANQETLTLPPGEGWWRIAGPAARNRIVPLSNRT